MPTRFISSTILRPCSESPPWDMVDLACAREVSVYQHCSMQCSMTRPSTHRRIYIRIVTIVTKRDVPHAQSVHHA
jgi:hypothetical protein